MFGSVMSSFGPTGAEYTPLLPPLLHQRAVVREFENIKDENPSIKVRGSSKCSIIRTY